MENAVLNLPHQALYATFAVAYALACFGLDEVIVWVLLAAGYTVLALSDG